MLAIGWISGTIIHAAAAQATTAIPTGETAEELLKELLLGETKTGEELQKVFAASYYCMYAVTIAHGSERAAETAELLCEKIQRAKNEFSGVLICSLPTGILFLVLQKSFANGIVGAVKG